jgi:hypothetical protein
MRWPGEVVHGRVVLEYERQEMIRDVLFEPIDEGVDELPEE